jgi:hypothetical protein
MKQIIIIVCMYLFYSISPSAYAAVKACKRIKNWIELMLLIKKATENFIDASEGVGLEMNIEKTKYVLLSRH